MPYVYPTTFCEYTLECFTKNGTRQCILYNHATVYQVHIAFPQLVFDDHAVFVVEVFEARDGGKPYLKIIDRILTPSTVCPPAVHDRPPTVPSTVCPPNVHDRPPTVHDRPPTVPSTVHDRPPTVHDRPPTVHDRPPTVPSTVHDRPLTVHDRPPTVHDRPPTVHDRPPTVHDRPPTVPSTVHDRPSTVHVRPLTVPSTLHIRPPTVPSTLHDRPPTVPSTVHDRPPTVHFRPPTVTSTVRPPTVPSTVQDRRAYVQAVLAQTCELQSDYRVGLIDLFDANDTKVGLIVPNYHGKAQGFALLTDKQIPRRVVPEVPQHLKVSRTRWPDVYTINQGSCVLYIPDLATSRFMAAQFQGKDSAFVQCRFNPERQKWQPMY